MSSSVKLNIFLIASTGLLPKEIMLKTFFKSLAELGGIVKDGTLEIHNQRVGKLLWGDRIIIQTTIQDNNQSLNVIGQLRQNFNEKAAIEVINYQYALKQEKMRLQQSELDLIELEKKLQLLEKKLQGQQKAIKKQNMSSCEAMVEELKEAAINQGYEVVEDKNEECVQLQFVRRDY